MTAVYVNHSPGTIYGGSRTPPAVIQYYNDTGVSPLPYRKKISLLRCKLNFVVQTMRVGECP